MGPLRLLSGGAANGLVAALAGDFLAVSGQTIDGVFGAVGAMRAKLDAGDSADLVILTSAMTAELADLGIVLAASVADLGRVETAVAVRAGDPLPAVTDAQLLRSALLQADAIYVPDTRQSTAGIHFAAVLGRLGIAAEVAARLQEFPNGATAMRALALAPQPHPIGCTQVTEIVATLGVHVVAPLPPGYDLATVYTAGVVAASTNRAAAQQLIALLAAELNAPVRAGCGFV